MKTAKQLFVDFESDDYPACITEESFYDAFIEHDKEIIAMIDEMIEERGLRGDLYSIALTELKQYILEQR